MPKTAPDWKALQDQVVRLAASLGLKIIPAPKPGEEEAAACNKCGEVKSGLHFHIDAELLTIALAWIRAREGRDKALGTDLFTDPAWDMLLDLYVQHCRHREVSVSSLSMASRAPATTALRWIALLAERGILLRKPDPKDGRRVLLSFTPEGLGKMEKTLSHASESDRKLGLGRLRFVK